MVSLRICRFAIFCSTLAFVSLRLSQAQNAPSVSPELAYRIESVLRSKVEFPPASSISFGALSPSEIPNYDRLDASFSSIGGETGKIPLLVSKDGTHIAQFSSYDIEADPKAKFAADDRPARGGPASAPVVIVVYDDLECPFCAGLHAELFPALTDRYKDQVRIVYRSFPVEGHPWAMRGAVDVSVLSTCVTKQTRDMRYSEAEPWWFLGSGRTHDDAVCPGKRVGSWINACSSCRVTKRTRCLSQTSVASSEYRGQQATDGSIATRKSARRASWT